MKFKRLAALLIAAAMGLMALPMSAFAAVDTSSITGLTIAGVTVATLNNANAAASASAANDKAISISIPYATYADSTTDYVKYTTASGDSITYAYEPTASVSDSFGNALGENVDGALTLQATDTYINIKSQTGLNYWTIKATVASPKSYDLTVKGGFIGTIAQGPTSGKYAEDYTSSALISVTAPEYKGSDEADLFQYWELGGLPLSGLTNAGKIMAQTVTFYMPSSNVTLSAYYLKSGSSGSTNTGNNGNNNAGGTIDGNTYINVTGGYAIDGVYNSTLTNSGYTSSTLTSTAQTAANLYGDNTIGGSYITLYSATENNKTFSSWTVRDSLLRDITNDRILSSADKTKANGAIVRIYGGESLWITANYNAAGTYKITVGSATGGSASVSATSVKSGSTVVATAYADAYYVFSGWTISGASVTYLSGGSTYPQISFTMPSANITITPSFTYDYYSWYYGGGYYYGGTTGSYPGLLWPGANNNANNTNLGNGTYTSGSATTKVSSSGVVQAGANATGSLNSATVVKGIQYALGRGLADNTVTVQVGKDITAISKSSVQKMINAADDYDAEVRLQIVQSYCTITIPVASARNIYTGIKTTGTQITSAKSLFKKAYGNNDIVAVQTTQTTTFGSSATYRFDADALGIDAGYGEKVYVAVYNPSTGKFVRKTVTVNSSGQIAFATSYAGVVLFSQSPFTK
ncbi:MAG: hypothetical protein LBM87_01835 [Ruminococcus sp.]|jgi:hypothetical protein|nr:hypothetical protein [Ruminococcus sp.]